MLIIDLRNIDDIKYTIWYYIYVYILYIFNKRKGKTMKRLFACLLCICTVFTLVTAVVPYDAQAVSYSGSSAYMSGPYYAALSKVRLTGNQRRDIVNVAKSQIGYQEGNNSSQIAGTVQGSNNYTEYGRWYTYHKDDSYNFIDAQWCAMFVSWCAYNAGIPQSIVPCCQYTEDQVRPFKNQGRAHRWSQIQSGAYSPKAGDIVFFLSSSGAASGRTVNHVGIVSGWDGRTLYTIEGNTSSAYFTTNGGCAADKTYDITSTYIAYICEPAYTNSDPIPEEMRTAIFDAEYYADYYADLRNALGTDSDKLYSHFIENGMKEGRRASAIFDIKHYLSANADLKAAFGENYEAAFNHFIDNGYKEPRYTAESADIGTRFFAKINYPSAGLCIAPSEGNVVTASPVSGTEQLWFFDRNSDGSYIITSYSTGKVLTVENGSYSKEANIGLTEKNGTSAQSWFLFENVNGTYSLRAKCAPICVMDIHGASTTAGANVQSYTYNSSAAQQFTVTKDTTVSADLEFKPTSSSIKSTTTADGVNLLKGFSTGISGSDATSLFSDTCKVYDESGSRVTSGKLCTGYTVKKFIGSIEVQSAVVVVSGDATGDGVANGKDLIRMKKQMLNGNAVKYAEYADANGDGVVNGSDLQYLTSNMG